MAALALSAARASSCPHLLSIVILFLNRDKLNVVFDQHWSKIKPLNKPEFV
jgi:hypothetical protein